jgi:hypothetical protein
MLADLIAERAGRRFPHIELRVDSMRIPGVLLDTLGAVLSEIGVHERRIRERIAAVRYSRNSPTWREAAVSWWPTADRFNDFPRVCKTVSVTTPDLECSQGSVLQGVIASATIDRLSKLRFSFEESSFLSLARVPIAGLTLVANCQD